MGTARGKPGEGGERSKRGRRENKHRTLHCCQVTSGGEADDQDDGGQRGEASHDSDSDHPVRLGSTGYTTHGDSTEYRLLQVFPGYHQNSTAGSWDHLYGLRSPSSNNQHAGLLWSRAQPLLPLHRRHHLHHHPHLDLLLPAPSEGHDKGETALHLHVDGGDLHPGSCSSPGLAGALQATSCTAPSVTPGWQLGYLGSSTRSPMVWAPTSPTRSTTTPPQSSSDIEEDSKDER